MVVPRRFPKGSRFLGGLIGLGWLAGGSLSGSGAGPVVIDEVLANNRQAVSQSGRNPDYVELRNATSTGVDLGGCTLADDGSAGLPLVFPSGTRLAPGARLVVWCDRTPGLPAPQAGFGIGASGDRIRLVGPDGSIWDEIAFGLQAEDLAIGRVGSGEGGLGEWRLILPSPGLANEVAALGDPSRLRINEWMSAPSAGDDWIEVFNGDAHPVALTGMVLTDRAAVPPANRPIPTLSFVGARGFVQFFASDLRQPDADHLDFRLSASGETVTLVASDRTTVVDRVSLGALNPDVSRGRVPDGGEGFLEFGPGRATPGAANGRELARVVISEVLAHTDPPLEDAIELHNPTSESVAIGDWWLSDAASTPRKFRIPAGTILPPGGFVVLYEFQFGAGPNGFSLNSYEGDEVWLSVGDSAGELTGEVGGVRFGATRNGVSLGRVVTSAGADFAPLSGPTFGIDAPSSVAHFRQGRGATNAPPVVSPVGLSEIFLATPANPAGGTEEPFVEWHLSGAAPTRLFDPFYPTNAWRIRGDLRFDLPTGLILQPGERMLLVSFDPAAAPDRLAAFRAAHGIPESVRILGPWSGEPGGGEVSLELQAPDEPEGPGNPRPGFVPYVRVDRVDYRPGAGWPADEGPVRRALRRQAASEHGNEPRAWVLDRPSPGREWPADPAADTDTDGDGIPDAWETLHGFAPGSPADAGEDADADGASNVDEYRAGTDPRNGADVLRLSLRWTGTGAARLTFPVVTGRIYRVEGRLLGGSETWSTVVGPVEPTAAGEWSIEQPLVEEPRVFRVFATLKP